MKRILDIRNQSPKKKTLGHTRSMIELIKILITNLRRKMIRLNSVGTDTPNRISTNTKIIIKKRRRENQHQTKKMMVKISQERDNSEMISTRSKKRRQTNQSNKEEASEETGEDEEVSEAEVVVEDQQRIVNTMLLGKITLSASFNLLPQ